MIRVRPCLVEGTLLEAVAALVPFVVFGADQIVQVGPGFSFSPATVTVVPGGMVTSTFQGQLWQGEANPCDSTGRAAMIAAARRPGTLSLGPSERAAIFWIWWNIWGTARVLGDIPVYTAARRPVTAEVGRQKEEWDN